MKKEIVVPEIGESVAQGIIVSWLIKNGEKISEGEALFELETEKATVTVPSTASGVVEILTAPGTTVKIGETVARIDTEVEPSAQPAAETNFGEKKTQPLPPSVRRIVEENRIDTNTITGSGKGGRITKADALNAAAATVAASTDNAGKPITIKNAAVSPSENVPLTSRGQTRVPMTLLRKRTAERLMRAQAQAVYVTTFNEIDMSNVSAIRVHYQENFEKTHGIKIGFMSFFVKACCKALKTFPELNAQVDGETIVYNNTYDIGVAVSTEKGLIVPVIRNADLLTFAEIESAVAAMAARAREGILTPDELTGGTFTITNGGVFGSLMSTPVPAYPQSAILGMHAIKKRPVAVDDQIVIHPLMYVALTYDHRIIDGKQAIGFLVSVKDFIEYPDKLLLEM
ncbi:MAG TPA: 2-oxoglutarate dehydrogenase complex dihydrolipoyllysine-residue succinyltransferase [Chitinivibrionales bacterium]